MWDLLLRLLGRGGPTPEAKAKPDTTARTSSPPDWWIVYEVDGRRRFAPVVAWDDEGALAWVDGEWIRGTAFFGATRAPPT